MRKSVENDAEILTDYPILNILDKAKRYVF